MAKVYTKVGDFGCTMIRQARVGKDAPVIEVIGAIDELQSSLDLVRLYAIKAYCSMIEKIQDKLRHLAGEVAGYITDETMLVTEEDIKHFEELIDQMADVVPNKFIRFNAPAAVYLNEARVRARSLERKMVPLLKDGRVRDVMYRYVNRLSDVFFVLSYKLEFSVEDYAPRA